MRRRRWWLGAAVVAMVLGAIGGGLLLRDDGPAQTKGAAADGTAGPVNRDTLAFSRSEADTFVPVTAPGFQFVGIPATVKGPKVLFEVKNDSGIPHDFHVIRAPGGEKMGHIEPFQPGETYSLALELPPGNYLAWCEVRLVDAPHSDLGMLNEFVVE